MIRLGLLRQVQRRDEPLPRSRTEGFSALDRKVDRFNSKVDRSQVRSLFIHHSLGRNCDEKKVGKVVLA